MGFKKSLTIAGLAGLVFLQASALPAAAAEEKTTVLTKVPVGLKLYGFIKVDVVFNDSAGDTLIMNAPWEGELKDDNQFNITSNWSRIGFIFDGTPIGESGKVSGKIEADFWDSSDYDLRLRQAFLTINYAKWSLLAGQTWDFFSPFGIGSLNDGYGWHSGNLGSRHPQLVFSTDCAKSSAGKVTLKLGAVDTQDDEQETTGYPVCGGLIGVERIISGISVNVYYASVFGTARHTDGAELEISAQTTGMKLKLCEWLSLNGEGYRGYKLEDFMAGSKIGVSDGSEVRTRGGWLEGVIKLSDKLKATGGAGIDDVYPNRLAADKFPTGNGKETKGIDDTLWHQNVMHYVNLKYKAAPNLTYGLEHQCFITQYADGIEGKINRIQGSMIYSF